MRVCGATWTTWKSVIKSHSPIKILVCEREPHGCCRVNNNTAEPLADVTESTGLVRSLARSSSGAAALGSNIGFPSSITYPFMCYYAPGCYRWLRRAAGTRTHTRYSRSLPKHVVYDTLATKNCASNDAHRPENDWGKSQNISAGDYRRALWGREIAL